MSKLKYAIRNGDNILGYLWKNEALGKVLVFNGEIDVSYDLEIYDLEQHKKIKDVDLKSFIFEAIPFK